MKINKISLDKLIMEIMKEQQTMVSANPLQDSPNPEKTATNINKNTLYPKKQPINQEKIDPTKVQVDKNILLSLQTSKEKIRTNLEKIPAQQLISEVETLLDQLSFLDNLNI